MRRRTITRLELDVRELVGVAVGIVLGALAVLILLLPPARLAYHKPRARHRHAHQARKPPSRTTTSDDWGAPEPAGSWPAPHLVDPTGYYTFDCGTDVSVGATINLCHPSGVVAGVYEDDTTPDLAAWVAKADAKYSLVVVGQAPDGPCEASGQAFCALEVYPFDCRYPPGAWGPIPRAQAYITQKSYGWPGCGPPTPTEAAQLLSDVEALHPRLLLTY